MVKDVKNVEKLKLVQNYKKIQNGLYKIQKKNMGISMITVSLIIKESMKKF